MYRHRLNQAGFSLLELLIVIVIIGVLVSIALPYYQNAVQSTRCTEAVIWWNQAKRMAAGHNLTQAQADRIVQRVNQEAKLAYFTINLVCRTKEDAEICWEAEFHLKVPNQSVQYYLSTQKNFLQLVCVPLNDAGDRFCQTQAASDAGPDTTVNEQPAYLIRY